MLCHSTLSVLFPTHFYVGAVTDLGGLYKQEFILFYLCVSDPT